MSRQPDSEYRELHEQVRQLTGRLEEIEESVAAVDRAAADEATVEALREDVRKLQGTLTTTVERLKNVEQELDNLDGVNNEVEGVRQLVADTKDSLTKKIRETNKRIANVEDTMDEKPAQAASKGIEIPDDASELAYLTALPQHVRKKHIESKSKLRAVEVHDNFDRWSEYTPSGYIIKSGDLKRLLSEDISWSQVYRVMETFAKNTEPEYAYIDKDSTGKALIRFVD